MAPARRWAKTRARAQTRAHVCSLACLVGHRCLPISAPIRPNSPQLRRNPASTFGRTAADFLGGGPSDLAAAASPAPPAGLTGDRCFWGEACAHSGDSGRMLADSGGLRPKIRRTRQVIEARGSESLCGCPKPGVADPEHESDHIFHSTRDRTEVGWPSPRSATCVAHVSCTVAGPCFWCAWAVC